MPSSAKLKPSALLHSLPLSLGAMQRSSSADRSEYGELTLVTLVFFSTFLSEHGELLILFLLRNVFSNNLDVNEDGVLEEEYSLVDSVLR